MAVQTANFKISPCKSVICKDFFVWGTKWGKLFLAFVIVYHLANYTLNLVFQNSLL